MTAMAVATADTALPARRFLSRPAPDREPPFDDEVTTRRLTLVGPLDQQLPFDAGTRSTQSAAGPTELDGRQVLPELSAFARRFVIGVIETATGRRPAAQLSQHTAASVQTGLTRDAGKINRLGTAARPATLHSLHITEPAEGVAEIAAVVQVGTRFRALAVRLEASAGRWRCVRLQIG